MSPFSPEGFNISQDGPFPGSSVRENAGDNQVAVRTQGQAKNVKLTPFFALGQLSGHHKRANLFSWALRKCLYHSRSFSVLHFTPFLC